jgi:hypothetical protein
LGRITRFRKPGRIRPIPPPPRADVTISELRIAVGQIRVCVTVCRQIGPVIVCVTVCTRIIVIVLA